MNPRLPARPGPPHDPLSYLLNGQAGWRIAAHSPTLELAPSGELALGPLGGYPPWEPGLTFGGNILPPWATLTQQGDLLLLESATSLLRCFDRCDCVFNVAPGTGGIGAGPRQWKNPGALGAFGETLFVADTGNARVAVFTLLGFALRGFWMPPPGANLAHPWQPERLAFDARGRLYVSDRANVCIHRFRRTGIWERAFPAPGVIAQMAFDTCGRLWIHLDGENGLRALDIEESGKELLRATRPAEIQHTFAPLPFPVTSDGTLDLRAFCGSGGFGPDGGPLALPIPTPPALERKGSVVIGPLDSQIFGCVWHRLCLEGALPDHASITCETYSADVERPTEFVESLPDSAWAAAGRAITPGSPLVWDGLIRSEPGRYLHLRLTLRGDGTSTPTLKSLQIEYPRISLRRYLPAVFGADPTSADFTDRFLALFDTTLRGLERTLDEQAKLFSIEAAPDDFLAFLASWIGLSLDRHWPEERRRRWLRAATRLYPQRGTLRGLQETLWLYLGMDRDCTCCESSRYPCLPRPANCGPEPTAHCPRCAPPPLILEHFRLRRLPVLGQARVNDGVLLASADAPWCPPAPSGDPFREHAHRFSVFVPARVATQSAGRRGLENLLRSESPAHLLYEIRPVYPRLRIGIQSCVGLDTVVGRYPEPGVLAGTEQTWVVLGAVTLGGAGRPDVGAAQIGKTTRLVKRG